MSVDKDKIIKIIKEAKENLKLAGKFNRNKRKYVNFTPDEFAVVQEGLDLASARGKDKALAKKMVEVMSDLDKPKGMEEVKPEEPEEKPLNEKPSVDDQEKDQALK